MFGGWARMAQPIKSFMVVEVASPRIGERCPARVRADVAVGLDLPHHIKEEWTKMRKHDICFLITVRPNAGPGKFQEAYSSAWHSNGLLYLIRYKLSEHREIRPASWTGLRPRLRSRRADR